MLIFPIWVRCLPAWPVGNWLSASGLLEKRADPGDNPGWGPGLAAGARGELASRREELAAQRSASLFFPPVPLEKSNFVIMIEPPQN